MGAAQLLNDMRAHRREESSAQLMEQSLFPTVQYAKDLNTLTVCNDGDAKRGHLNVQFSSGYSVYTSLESSQARPRLVPMDLEDKSVTRGRFSVR